MSVINKFFGEPDCNDCIHGGNCGYNTCQFQLNESLQLLYDYEKSQKSNTNIFSGTHILK